MTMNKITMNTIKMNHMMMNKMGINKTKIAAITILTYLIEQFKLKTREISQPLVAGVTMNYVQMVLLEGTLYSQLKPFLLVYCQ